MKKFETPPGLLDGLRRYAAPFENHPPEIFAYFPEASEAPAEPRDPVFPFARDSDRGLGVLLLTAVFDNVLVGTGIVGYDATRLSGAYVGVAPIEDFAYAIAAVLLLPALWRLLTPSAPRTDTGETPR